jgi:hypothetical protein
MAVELITRCTLKGRSHEIAEIADKYTGLGIKGYLEAVHCTVHHIFRNRCSLSESDIKRLIYTCASHYKRPCAEVFIKNHIS